mgnify:CR=1 FL=1
MPCVFEQLGDGTSGTDRLTPVSVTPVNVSGLTSGVVSVALGAVRLFA